jgi:carboxymethylenebutenolidase
VNSIIELTDSTEVTMPYSTRSALVRIVPALALIACSSQMGNSAASNQSSESGSKTAATVASAAQNLPADAEHAMERLNSSPRHGEWATISKSATDSIRAWVVYPERKTKAPVVVVIHEIYGLSTWVRAVADQLAADGFIAIAPDLLTMTPRAAGSDTLTQQEASTAIRSLDPAWVQQQVDAAAKYGMALPAAQPRYGIVGYCWGGGVSFAHATHSPSLGAAVVYYGVSPAIQQLSSVKAPVLGLYGGNDARVDATIPLADSALRAMGKTYVHNIYDGAGHGFLRQQSGANGANMTATQQAWPATITWFKRYLEG